MIIKPMNREVKKKYQKGDRIIFPADTWDADTGLRKGRLEGAILHIYPTYTLVDVGKYRTTVHNHIMLTSHGVRKVRR